MGDNVYKNAKKKFHSNKGKLLTRFYPYFMRKKDTAISLEMRKLLCAGKYHAMWKGAAILKDPLTLFAYMQMLQEIPVKTIFELGTYQGAFAIWLADMLLALKKDDFHIYSCDIDLSLLHETISDTSHVSFIEMDVLNIKDVFTSTFLANCPKPWIFIEDCHVNVFQTLEYMDLHFQNGDYISVEDTNPNGPKSLLMGSTLSDKIYEAKGLEISNCVTEFIRYSPHKYLVDSYYCDLFGLNSLCQFNSILKRF